MITKKMIRNVAFVLVAVACNTVLAGGVSALGIPLYFDSIGTMAVALHLGFAPGMITALLTHVMLAALNRVLFPFVCCSMLTVVVVTAMKSRMLQSGYTGYLWMGALSGLGNGLGGSVLAFFLFAGITEVHSIDRLVMGFLITGQQMLTAVFWAGMLTNLIDKLMSALVVFLLAEPLTRLHETPPTTGELVK